jgi:hypothetical protein
LLSQSSTKKGRLFQPKNTTNFKTMANIIINLPLTFCLAGLICAITKIYRHRINITGSYLTEAIMRNYFIWVLGATNIYIGLHLLLLNIISVSSIASLLCATGCFVTGVAALLTHKKTYQTRTKIIIASVVVLLLSAAQPIPGNTATSGNNNLLVFWVCLLQPIASIITWVTARAWAKKSKPLKLYHPANFLLNLSGAR